MKVEIKDLEAGQRKTVRKWTGMREADRKLLRSRAGLVEGRYCGTHDIGVCMASPEDCKSLQEVRQEIDWIDEEIVARIGQRTRYGEAAARFKTSEAYVAAPERLQRCRQCGGSGPNAKASTPQ